MEIRMKATSPRRRMVIGAASVAGLLGWAGRPLTAATIDEGIDFRQLGRPVPTGLAQGKIEVLEFFWYACPHCFALEPYLKPWVSKLPADVVFRKAHVAFRGSAQQQLFYTLEAMMSPDATHHKAFEAIHLNRQPLASEAEIFSWAKTASLDMARFERSWRSPAVANQMKRAVDLQQSHEVDGVPRFTVNGRYVTSPAMVGGSHQRSLAVVDFLIKKSRDRGA